MYSYSGWNAASYIVGEVRNPAQGPCPARSSSAPASSSVSTRRSPRPLSLHHAHVGSLRQARGRRSRRRLHLRRDRRPCGERADLRRPRRQRQRDDVDRLAGEPGDWVELPGPPVAGAHDAARHSLRRRARAVRHHRQPRRVRSRRGRDLRRVGALLLVAPRRRRRHRPARARTQPAPALPHLGLPGHAGPFRPSSRSSASSRPASGIRSRRPSAPSPCWSDCPFTGTQAARRGKIPSCATPLPEHLL